MGSWPSDHMFIEGPDGLGVLVPMKTNVLPLSVSRNGQITLDDNGLPFGHKMGLHAARQEYIDFLNELPDGWLHICPTDSELGSERVIAAYLAGVKREQR